MVLNSLTSLFTGLDGLLDHGFETTRPGACEHFLQVVGEPALGLTFGIFPVHLVELALQADDRLAIQAGVATGLPHLSNANTSPLASTVIVSPGAKSPARMRRASGFSICCRMRRFRGRAP